MIDIKNLIVKYGDETILDNITVKIDRKTMLLGPNGAGKTTLFKVILGLVGYNFGKIFVDNRAVEKISGEKHLISANLPEVYQLLFVPLYDLLDLYMDLLDGSKDKALEILGALGLKSSLLKRRKIYQLSAGQLKSFTTALALAVPAKNKLLDEPFEQLDPAKKKVMSEVIETDKQIIVLSTHELWILNKFNPNEWDVVFLFEGKIHGKIRAKELLGSYLYIGEHPEAIIKITTKSGVVSIIKEETEYPLTNILSLDMIYQIL